MMPDAVARSEGSNLTLIGRWRRRLPPGPRLSFAPSHRCWICKTGKCRRIKQPSVQQHRAATWKQKWPVSPQKSAASGEWLEDCLPEADQESFMIASLRP